MLKKLLLISCSVGQGHYRTAEAIRKTAQTLYPDIIVKHLDYSKMVDPISRIIFFDSYYFFSNYTPSWWRFFYKKTNHEHLARFNRLTAPFKKINLHKISAYLDNFQPDYILCTHFTPADILINHLKTSIPTGLVNTDHLLTHTSFLPSPQLDYFVANESIKETMIKEQIPEKKITISGIPVDPIFYQEKNIEELRKKYQLTSQPIILLMAWESGKIKTIPLIKELTNSSKDRQIIVVTGKNLKLKKQLEKFFQPDQLKIFGWTEEIDELMRLADVIISKPGGAFVSETLILQKPLITINPIPGQEDGNIEFLIKNNLGVWCQDYSAIKSMINQVIDNKKTFNNWPQLNSGEIILKQILKEA